MCYLHLQAFVKKVHQHNGTEEASGKTEKFFRSLLQNVLDVVAILEADGTLRYVSPGVEAMLGYTPEQVTGTGAFDYVHPDDLERAVGALAETLVASGALPPLEFRARRADGTWRHVEVVRNNRLDDPAVGGVVINVRDVTGRKEAEERLREIERRLSSLLSSTPAMVYRCLNEPDWPEEYVSDYALELTGYPASAFLENPTLFGSLITEQDQQRIWDEVQEAVGKNERFRMHYAIHHRDGSLRFVEELGQAVYDESGKIVALEGLIYDVTDRKRVEERLREAEDRYRTLVERVPAITYIHHQVPGGFSGTTYVSPQVESVLGYTKEEYTADPEFWKTIIHPDDRAWVLAEDERIGDSGEPFDLEFRMIGGDGSVVWLRQSETLVREEDGGYQVWHGVMFDITELKRVEGELRGAEERYRTLVERIPAIVYVQEVDEPSRTTYVSPQNETVLGYTPEECLADPDHWIKITHPEDRERVLTEDGRTNETGDAFSMEYRQFAKDGRVVWLRDEATLVRDEGGQPLYWLGVQTDVTGRKAAEEQLRESEERFRRSFDDAVIGMALVAPDGRFLLTNRSLCEILGYPEEDLLGRTFQEVTHPDDLGRDLDNLRKLLAGESRTYQAEKRYLHKEGHVVWILLSVSLVRDTGGEPMYFVSQLQDVSERKRAEEALREAEERYRTLVERIPAVTFVDRAEGSEESLYVSPQIEGMLGYTPEEWMEGKLWRERLHPEDRERMLASDERFNADGEPVDQEYRLLAKDGSVVWVREETVLVRGRGGEPLYVQGIMSDVTEKKEAEEALRKSQAGLAEAQRLAHLGSWEWDPRTGELYWSDETFRIYGYEPQSFVPTFEKLLQVVHPDDRRTLGRALEEALSGDRPYDFEHRVVRPDSEVRVVHRQAEVMRDESGTPIRMVGTVHDITERKAMEEQMEHRAFHDGLTDLPNRQLFVDRLAHALRRTKRSKKRRVAVLFMDLDGFKVVNDSLGHEAGDSLLVAVAGRLRECLRPVDTLARFGGDEFVVLLEDAEGLDEPVLVAERIIDELGGPFVLEGRELYARVSIGIALGEGRTKGPDDLLRDADTAMYKAKEGGSGYAVFDPGMYERVIERLQVENDLKRAIEREEFVVHYQPIVDLRTGELSTVEALVRWAHPKRGLLNPDEFVPIAEESGFVIPMGEQVLREACHRANQWQEQNPHTSLLRMSVNLSAGQLSRPGLAETVETILQETGLEGSRLTLDVTETVYVKTLEDHNTVMDRLRSLGVRISIDDFGMGYSSLSYLKRLPADALKIDKSFVGGLKENGADMAIVRMMIGLAHTLGMEVIAEGVETREQAALLTDLGCDFGQGFHFSKPLPPEDLSKHLTKASNVPLKGA